MRTLNVPHVGPPKLVFALVGVPDAGFKLSDQMKIHQPSNLVLLPKVTNESMLKAGVSLSIAMSWSKFLVERYFLERLSTT